MSEVPGIEKVICLHQCSVAMSSLAGAGLDPGLPVLAAFVAALTAEILEPSKTQKHNVRTDVVQFSHADLHDLRALDLYIEIDDKTGVFTLSLQPCTIVMQQFSQVQQSGEPERGN